MVCNIFYNSFWFFKVSSIYYWLWLLKSPTTYCRIVCLYLWLCQCLLILLIFVVVYEFTIVIFLDKWPFYIFMFLDTIFVSAYYWVIFLTNSTNHWIFLFVWFFYSWKNSTQYCLYLAFFHMVIFSLVKTRRTWSSILWSIIRCLGINIRCLRINDKMS